MGNTGSSPVASIIFFLMPICIISDFLASLRFAQSSKKLRFNYYFYSKTLNAFLDLLLREGLISG